MRRLKILFLFLGAMKELLETKFSIYNKYVAQELWTLAAVMLWELVSEYDYYEKVNKLWKDGSFYSSINNVQDATWLTRRNQDTAIAILEWVWILTKTFNKEEGNKRYFKLNPLKIAEYTKYEWEVEDPLYESAKGYVQNDRPFVQNVQTLCTNQPELCTDCTDPLYELYNHKQIINNSIENNNKNNIIGEQKFLSNADASPSCNEHDVKTELDEWDGKKTKRKTKKQQRYNEVTTSTEFNTTLLDWITNEKDKEEIAILWNEYVELRCSKDYRAFTDWAVKRNLKVLTWTAPAERKAILEKSVTKWYTGLFPLNEFDKKRIAENEANVEWSDEWLYNKIFKTKCREKEDELPEGTTHNLLMELCEKYWEDKIKDIYYTRVRPEIQSIYWIKRDWFH